jgi:beta-exotoxin I transport system permease protein
VLTLVARSLRRVAPANLGLAAVLGGFQLLLVAVAASYERAGSFDQLAMLLPAFAQQAFGTAMTSFAAMSTVGFYETGIVLMVALFAIFVAAEPAGDVEAGFVDMILARPLPRHWMVTRSLLAMTVATLILTLTMGASLWIALLTLAPAGARRPEPRIVLTLIAHLITVSCCFGAAAVAAAGWARRRAAALAPVALAALALYLLDFLGAWWTAMPNIGRISPFHYYQGAAIVEGRANTLLDLSVLGAATLAASALAYWQFGRRDL